MSEPIPPQELIDGLKARKVTLFVGAGVSAAAGLPGWDALMTAMKKQIRAQTREDPKQMLEFIKSASQREIADQFRGTVGESAYFGFLRDRYRKNVPLSPLHHSLAKLQLKTVFTNYDKLLEVAFRDGKGCDPAVILFADQINYISDGERRIIKLHGDIDHPSTIVLSARDYRAYPERQTDFAPYFKHILNDTTMLFVGFGLRDPNIEILYDDARGRYGGTHRQAYALMTGVNPIRAKVWHERKLTILNLSGHPAVPKYVDRLCKMSR